ncbi:MAG: preprotein translocase subunit SecA [Candidatus Paceibacterota bacterium]
MLNTIKKLFGDSNSRTIKSYLPIIEKINSLEAALAGYSDEALLGKTQEFKTRLDAGETLDEILPEAFAVVREVSKRTLGQRHFDVQLIGGIALHKGSIAEMRTGEGKTLVATLPVYLNALTGKGVHVVTVNDYLSRRDAVWMGQIYSALGLSVGVINHESSFLYDPKHSDVDKKRDELGSFKVVHEFLRPCTRREAYTADITYGTNNEYGFDYLRDNIEYSAEQLRQREYNFAVVDEIDSILIDESRTPLIISSPTTDSEDLYYTFANIATGMNVEEHFKVDEKLKAITLTDAGIEYAEKKLGVDNIYTEKGIKYVHHLETAVRAKALFHKDKEYVVREDGVIIVDEFTGRLQPGRRWSEGLHQAIEAKERQPIQKETRTFASITFQNYFRLYKKLAGMTGTAATSKEEFYKVYGLDVISVPTNKVSQRVDRNDFMFQTEHGKFKAIARIIKELNTKGQPVLVGTASIEKNEVLSQYLVREGVKHEVLNAKNHEREGEIIAQAGRKGAVTIATNMAGRGVDIKLGGVPAIEEAAEEIKGLGGLFVIGTERHEARRTDNQLRGRSGRQGDPGETQFYVSLEDSLMRVFATDTVKKMMGTFKIKEDEPIENYILNRAIESAQTKIEGFHFDARKHVLEYDDVLNIQRKSVYERRRKILLGTPAEVEEKLNEILESADESVKEIVQKKKETLGEVNFWNAVRGILLQTIDMFWVEHLEVMDYMRGSVNLRAYGQRDPLVEYKREGLRLFREMQAAVAEQVLKIIPAINEQAFAQEKEQLQEVHDQAVEIGSGDGSGNVSAVSEEDKIGRNDMCPCGSGKKYKNCGLKDTEEHKGLMTSKS